MLYLNVFSHKLILKLLATLPLFIAFSGGIAMAEASSPLQGYDLPFEISSLFIRGTCSTVPTGAPSTYENVISDVASHGFNIVNGFHGSISNNLKLLEIVGQHDLKFIVSIPLICWIRFGDPPYTESGPLGWENILAWFALYSHDATNLPPPFDQGPDGDKPLSDKGLAEQVRNIIESFRSSPYASSIPAFYAFDEPVFNNPGVIDRIARVHHAFLSYGSSAKDLPFSPVITGIFFWAEDSRKLAREYIVKSTGYGEPPSPKPPCIMYDCYVLSGEPEENFADYENYAKDWVDLGIELDMPVIVVPMGFEVKGRPVQNEMRAQVYLALASGCKGVNWFRYETIKTMDPSMWEEVKEVNEELKVIGPTLMKLDKVENIASISGCGGKYSPGGLINTFRHRETSRKYVFLASRDASAADVATVSFRKDSVGYGVEWIRDCLTGDNLDLRDLGESFSFSLELPPGGGRLVELGQSDT